MHSWTSVDTAPFLTPWRSAAVRRVVDGDTLDVLVNLGFDVHIAARVRLLAEGHLARGGAPASYDAPEMTGTEADRGKLAKARAERLCPVGAEVRIYSVKGGSQDKYGRWLAVVLTRTGEYDWRSLGDTLIMEGHTGG